MMKKLGILLLVLLIWSCSRNGEKDMGSASQRTEITPFKINKILLRDTQLIKSFFVEADSGRMSINEYEINWGREYKFLDYTSFNALRKAIWALVKNPESKVYVNPMGNVSTKQEVNDRVVACGMIEESTFDAEGNEIIKSRFNCDSMSTIRNINQIRFFEAWYFNPETNMIERELLGYSVHEFVSDKNAFRELFDVFVNDAALQKARKYYFNKQAQ
ncbi:MAG: hypothetical protein KA163_09310 [Bacteroidia bacterium]|nr:hypothetical protein [Bacteroidia bacterium]